MVFDMVSLYPYFITMGLNGQEFALLSIMRGVLSSRCYYREWHKLPIAKSPIVFVSSAGGQGLCH